MRQSRRSIAVRRVSGGALVLAVLVGGLLPPAEAAEPPVTATVTTMDLGQRHAALAAPAVRPLSASSADTTIAVDPSIRYQEMLGFGGSMESSSVANLMRLTATERTKALQALSSRSTGNGFNLVRLAFGCSDFCSHDYYTYDDNGGVPDPELRNFSIQTDITDGIVGVARQLRDINPDTRFFASLWSPPAWMKTNNSLNNGGEVKREYYPVLAAYYRKAIQAYAAQGIEIYAVTAQNEPTVVPNYPSATWSWEQQRDFVKVLGADLRSHGLATKIWIQDDNLLRTDAFAGNILADPEARRYVDGVGYHDYEGDPGYTGDITAPARIRAAYPNTGQHITERSYYDAAGSARLIQAFRNGISSHTYWLTFLDAAGQPNRGPLDGSCCPTPITSPAGNPAGWRLTRDYYLYGHFSRYVDRGAVRVASNEGANQVSNVAFTNPDGEVVVVAVNQADAARSVKVMSPDGETMVTLPPRSLATVRWQSVVGRAIDQAMFWAAGAPSETNSPAGHAIDWKPGTRWTTGQPQGAGPQELTIAFNGAVRFDRINLDQGDIDQGRSAQDWPRAYTAAVSDDGQTWRTVATGAGTPYLTHIRLAAPVTARFLRIRQTGQAGDGSWWSVAELSLYCATC